MAPLLDHQRPTHTSIKKEEDKDIRRTSPENSPIPISPLIQRQTSRFAKAFAFAFEAFAATTFTAVCATLKLRSVLSQTRGPHRHSLAKPWLGYTRIYSRRRNLRQARRTVARRSSCSSSPRDCSNGHSTGSNAAAAAAAD